MRNKTKAVLPEWASTIKAARRKLRLSQSELAEKLETSAMAVSRWERGEFEPSADAGSDFCGTAVGKIWDAGRPGWSASAGFPGRTESLAGA
jgi:DNA-binding XRE family transcriptional regulator